MNKRWRILGEPAYVWDALTRMFNPEDFLSDLLVWPREPGGLQSANIGVWEGEVACPQAITVWLTPVPPNHTLLRARCQPGYETHLERLWQRLSDELDLDGQTETGNGEDKHTALPKAWHGCRPDQDYDAAYEQILSGRSRDDAFDWFCDVKHIDEPTAYEREAFNTAMRRRSKKTT